MAGGVRGHHPHACGDVEADATLRLFDNHLDLQQRILVIARIRRCRNRGVWPVCRFGKPVCHGDRRQCGEMNYRASVSDPAEHYSLKGYCVRSIA